MDVFLIVSNVLSFIGMTLFFISSFLKSKKRILLLQSSNHFLNSIGMSLVGRYSGASQDGVSLIRNIFLLLGKNNKFLTCFFISLAFGLGLTFNIIDFVVNANVMNFIMGFLPVLANLEYSIVILLPNVKVPQIKMAMAVSALLWGTYSFYIGIIPNGVFNVAICIASLVAFGKYYVDKKKGKIEEEVQEDKTEEKALGEQQ